MESLPPEVMENIGEKLEIVDRKALSETSSYVRNTLNHTWYNELKRFHYLGNYDPRIDYLNLYQKVYSDYRPVISDAELVQYFAEFSNLLGKVPKEFVADIRDIDYKFLIKYINSGMKERNSDLDDEILEIIYDMFYRQRYEEPSDLEIAFIDYVKSQYNYEFHYFTFFNPDNIKVKARYHNLPVTPENVEKCKQTEDKYYPMVSTILRNGYTPLVQIFRYNNVRIYTLRPYELYRDFNVDSHRRRFNTPDEVKPLIENMINDFIYNPTKYRDGVYPIDNEYSMRISNFGGQALSTADFPYPKNHAIGFSKNKLKEAIVNSGLPTYEYTFMYTRRVGRNRRIRVPTTITSIKTSLLNSNYEEINVRYGKARPSYVQGFGTPYKTRGYYETMYRMLFNTVIYTNWRSLCYMNNRIDYIDNLIRFMAMNDFQLNITNVSTGELCKMMDFISNERLALQRDIKNIKGRDIRVENTDAYNDIIELCREGTDTSYGTLLFQVNLLGIREMLPDNPDKREICNVLLRYIDIVSRG